MSSWLTDKGGCIQDDTPNRVVTETNQLFCSNGVVYLIPRNTVTDNYTIPFGINKTRWDTRPSHLHDIGCRYHKVLVVDLPLDVIYSDYLYIEDNKVRCKDIPIDNIIVKGISFKECNDLLYKAMMALGNIPKPICKLYRLGVNFNLNWLFTNNNLLYINTIYNNKLYT